MQKKKGLGKGLKALIPQETIDKISEEKTNIANGLNQLKITDIVARDNQPRQYFDEEALKDLSKSIKEHGVLQPIIVVNNNDKYEIIAGERRYRAAKLAGLKEIPVIIKDSDSKEVAILSLIENIQREDLNAYEEAMGYTQLQKDFKLTQEKLSEMVGKSRPYIANSLRLLKLDEESLEELKNGNLTQTQARTLLSIENLKERAKYRNLLLNKKTNIKEIEGKKKSVKATDVFVDDAIARLRDALGTKVDIKKTGKRWKLNIEFYNVDEIEALIEKLGAENA